MFCNLTTQYDLAICDWCISNKYIVVNSNDLTIIYQIPYGLDAPEIAPDIFKREDAHKAIYDNIVESDPTLVSLEYNKFMAIDKIYKTEKAKTDEQVAKIRYVITALRDLATKYVDPPDILNDNNFINSLRHWCMNDNFDAPGVLYYLVNKYDGLVKETKKRMSLRSDISDRIDKHAPNLDINTKTRVLNSVFNYVYETAQCDQNIDGCIENAVYSHIFKKQREQLVCDMYDKIMRSNIDSNNKYKLTLELRYFVHENLGRMTADVVIAHCTDKINDMIAMANQ